jgi:hypothetical protein
LTEALLEYREVGLKKRRDNNMIPSQTVDKKGAGTLKTPTPFLI